MQERRICQSDIIKYINEELGIPYSSLCTVIDKVRPGNMVEPRISEIKRGKRKGYKELENHEDLFFDTCFTIKDEELGFHKLREFIEREKLIFPNHKGLQDDDYKSYSLRMLKYGLENCELPSSHKNIVLLVEDLEYIKELTVVPEDILDVIDIEEYSNKIDTNEKNRYISSIRENWNYIFLCFVFLTLGSIIFSIYRISAMDMFFWMKNMSPALFSFLTLFISVSTVIFGFVDTGIAVFIYNIKNKSREKLTYKDIYMIAKYGDKDKIIQGRGRYDLGISHICYSLFCNITGALCALALYSYLKKQESFDTFLLSKDFSIVANIALMFVLVLVFVNSFLLFTREPMKDFHDIEENPDTLKITRLSVIANNVHIAVNIFFSSMGILFSFMYGFSSYNVMGNISPMFCLVLIGLYSYLWFSSTSPYAVEFNAQCAGSFLLLAPFIASVTSLYTIMCFNNSTSYMMVIGVNVIAVIVWLVCLIYKEERKLAPVMRNNKIYFSVYASLLVLFFIILNCI
ncbi:hypothetical protein [Lachnoanaerobaculum gingivalis]|uniref:hypothetical protein n=1 Tax=Lachnoanaerobaculum gingivalis TaxID=2490855 RepID=UPI0028D51339|nr:hypothetical protein [Lachnoanaerobaculum gingivalis]